MLRSVCCWLLLCLLVVAASARGAGDPNLRYELLSSYWLPYQPDKRTLGIFHMDAAKPVSDRDLAAAMDSLLEDGAAAEEGLVNASTVAADALIDGGELGLHGKYVGAVTAVAEGRFGGGMRLDGGCLVLPVYDKLQGAFTVEAWLRPTGAATGPIFVALDEFGKPALALWRGADGALAVKVRGVTLAAQTAAMLPADQWTHVAWVVRDSGGGESVLLVNGERLSVVAEPAVGEQLARLAGRILVATADPEAAGTRLTIDELRVSSDVRAYYPLVLDWLDADGTRTLAQGPPYLRDAADRVLALDFDGAPGAAGQSAPQRHVERGPADAAWRYETGIRGQALLVGSGGPAPIVALAEALAANQGTVSFWFRPQGWDNRRVQGFVDPMEHVPLLRLRGPGKNGPRLALEIGVLHKKAMGKPAPLLIHPGRWRQVTYTWRGGERQLYLDGQPAPESTLYTVHPEGPEVISELLVEPGPEVRGSYLGQQTLIDGLELYRRALTEPEVANAWARYAPQPTLQPLPFADVAVTSYRPTGHVAVRAELLGEGRERVASAQLVLRAPDTAEPLADVALELRPDGVLAWQAEGLELAWGTYTADLRFLDAAGAEVHAQRVPHVRARPPWYENDLGIHAGQVLPGYAPLTVDGTRIGMGRRQVTIGADGWPAAIEAVGEPILAGPMRPELTVGGAASAFTPDGAATVTAESAADVTSSGSATAAGLRLSTEIRTHYDGLMRVRATLSPVAGPVTVDRFRLEVPYHAERAIFLSYWAGAQNFRAATSHGLTPADPGVVFDSRTPRRPRDPALQGSFIPYLLLGDDFRTLAWFAESDRGWTIDGPEPAVAVERRGDQVVLILTILCAPTEIAAPHSVEFAFMPSPFRDLRPDHRQQAMAADFGFVDDFSVQSLKSDETGTASFTIYPVDEDWDAVPARVAKHRAHYGRSDHYPGPILYVDRNWVGTPPNTREFRGDWFTSGFMRYYRDAADCHLYYMNEWLRRGSIGGIYIDDIWLNICRDARFGPAYKRPDGGIQPGYEWYDYHTYMERLRWLFHENDMEPLIWAHQTETPWSPTLSFVDIALEGEYRFPDWGAKRTFPQSWGAARLRFHNGRKWGYTSRWMNKIGNDKPKVPGIEHWEYRQLRSYLCYLLLHDVQDWTDTRRAGDTWRQFVDRGPGENPPRFIGYWEAVSPVVAATPGVLTSVYTDGQRALLLIANNTAADLTATLTLDPARFGIPGLTADNMTITDVDTYLRPPGEDVMRMAQAQVTTSQDVTAEDTGDLDDLTAMFEEAVVDAARDDAEAAGEVFYDDQNFTLAPPALTLLIRDFNYRLLLVAPATEPK